MEILFVIGILSTTLSTVPDRVVACALMARIISTKAIGARAIGLRIRRHFVKTNSRVTTAPAHCRLPAWIGCRAPATKLHGHLTQSDITAQTFACVGS